jgi:hypothetical protein
MLVHLVEAREHRAEVVGSDREHRRKPIAESIE